MSSVGSESVVKVASVASDPVMSVLCVVSLFPSSLLVWLDLVVDVLVWDTWQLIGISQVQLQVTWPVQVDKSFREEYSNPLVVLRAAINAKIITYLKIMGHLIFVYTFRFRRFDLIKPKLSNLSW